MKTTRASSSRRPALAGAARVRRAFHEAAQTYRARRSHGDAYLRVPAEGGFVTFYGGQADGWIGCLDALAARAVLPGTRAVPSDPQGQVYVARGGTVYDGAKRWEALALR